MHIVDGLLRVSVLKCFSNLFTGHIELTGIILIEITGQGAEGTLGGEGEGGSHFGFVLSPATVVRLTVVDSVLNPLRFEEP